MLQRTGLFLNDMLSNKQFFYKIGYVGYVATDWIMSYIPCYLYTAWYLYNMLHTLPVSYITSYVYWKHLYNQTLCSLWKDTYDLIYSLLYDMTKL